MELPLETVRSRPTSSHQYQSTIYTYLGDSGEAVSAAFFVATAAVSLGPAWVSQTLECAGVSQTLECAGVVYESIHVRLLGGWCWLAVRVV